MPPGSASRLARRWAISELNRAGGIVDVGSVDLTFNLGGLGFTDAGEVQLLVDTDGDGSFQDEAPIGGAQLVGAEVYQFAGVSALQDGSVFTVAKSDGTLPVELTDFTAVAEPSDQVTLRWRTATETDHAAFVVERFDPLGWTDLATIRGVGTRHVATDYHYVDTPPVALLTSDRLLLYRLRQVDLDGHTTCSPIRSVRLGQQLVPTGRIYPNRVEDWLTLPGAAASVRSLRLLDGLGREVTGTVTIEPAGRDVQIRVANLAAGSYLLQWGTGHQTFVNK